MAGETTSLEMFLSEVQHMSHRRCLNEIFLTWNESRGQLHDLLATVHQHHPDIRMVTTVNDNINFLDVNISQIDGALKIQVVHDLNTDPYALPYVFGHRGQKYSTLPAAAFIRAVRCCADVFDFANELEDIQLSFQYNRFPTHFFVDKFRLFLEEFDATELTKLLDGEASYDQSLYDYLRQNVSNYNQLQRRLKLKRCQRQTAHYRWK